MKYSIMRYVFFIALVECFFGATSIYAGKGDQFRPPVIALYPSLDVSIPLTVSIEKESGGMQNIGCLNAKTLLEKKKFDIPCSVSLKSGEKLIITRQSFASSSKTDKLMFTFSTDELVANGYIVVTATYLVEESKKSKNEERIIEHSIITLIPLTSDYPVVAHKILYTYLKQPKSNGSFLFYPLYFQEVTLSC